MAAAFPLCLVSALALSKAVLPLIPLGILVAAFVTFEVGMGLAISTMPFDPKRRSWPQWTQAEKARCIRCWLATACFWPLLLATLAVHILLPLPGWLAWDFLLAGCFVWFLRWLGRARQRRQWLAEGRCGQCGYDLRGLPAGSACPECGTEGDGGPDDTAR